MWPDVDIEVVTGTVRAIPVPVTSTDIQLLASDSRLCGWSLREASGDAASSVSGQQVSPAAQQAIATSPALAAGTYDVSWQVELIGAAAAADANNFQLAGSGFGPKGSLNAGAAGQYPQVNARVTVTAGSTIVVRANAIGTVGVTYAAQLSVTPALAVNAAVELQDGGQPLAEIGLIVGGSDTNFFGESGVHDCSQINLHVVSGIVTGVVFAKFRR